MLKAEVLDVCGFEPAIHGMRNPMNSWDISDSIMCDEGHCDKCNLSEELCEIYSKEPDQFRAGENDMKLMKSLFKGGTEHRKYLRMIQVYVDITAPLYWWKEFDTYKIGTVVNSCSTMHKIHAKEFTIDDFSHEHMTEGSIDCMNEFIYQINYYREQFLETKDKQWWWQMIQLLPSSYNQKRTVMLNYEVIYNIIRQRSGHKLDEWHQLIDVLKTLPYLEEIMGDKL